MALKRPDHMVIYICHTNISSLDLYRTLATELGVPIAHRRGQLWTNIKKGLVELVDDKNICPVVIIDEAQNLSDDFLLDLAAFLNFAFDSRDILTLWLVGLPPLTRKLRMHQHAALATRIAAEIRMDPLEREVFVAAIEHGLNAVGATQKLLGDQAVEMLYRSTRGVLRIASKVLRTALRVAHTRNQSFIDEQVMQAALDEMGAS
jgi:type II secretory pathway predicted ATPase ExeA